MKKGWLQDRNPSPCSTKKTAGQSPEPQALELKSPLDFSLVIACYFEEPHLFANVMALKKYLAATKLQWEMIFVEDASPDGTAREVRKCVQTLTAEGFTASAIFHTGNQGRGATVQEGFLAARGAVVGYIDIDLEHPMDAILPMYLSIRDGSCDGLVGKRAWDKTTIHPVRNIASLAYRLISHSVMRLSISDSEAGLKLFNREKILPVLASCKDPGWFWDTEICDQAERHGLILKDHPIVFVKNPNKISTVHVFRDSLVFLKRLFAYRRQAKVRKDGNREIPTPNFEAN